MHTTKIDENRMEHFSKKIVKKLNSIELNANLHISYEYFSIGSIEFGVYVVKCIESFCMKYFWLGILFDELISLRSTKFQFGTWTVQRPAVQYFLVDAIEFRSFLIHCHNILLSWIVWNKEDYIIAAFKYKRGVFNILNEVFPAVVFQIWLFNLMNLIGGFNVNFKNIIFTSTDFFPINYQPHLILVHLVVKCVQCM